MNTIAGYAGCQPAKSHQLKVCCSMLFRRVRGFNAFALTGRMYPPLPTQGVALGYWLIGLSGRTKANPKLESFIRNNKSQLITISFS
jgi:hypothetical protein